MQCTQNKEKEEKPRHERMGKEKKKTKRIRKAELDGERERAIYLFQKILKYAFV